jgi:hypothetical protein
LDALKSNAFPKKDIDYMLSYYERKKEVIQWSWKIK